MSLFRSFVALMVPFALGACAARPPHVAGPPPPGPGWRYEVALDAAGRELSAEAIFPPGSPAEFHVEYPADGFVRQVVVLDPNTRGGREARWWRVGLPRHGSSIRGLPS